MTIKLSNDQLFYACVMIVAVFIGLYANGHIGKDRVIPLPIPAPTPRPNADGSSRLLPHLTLSERQSLADAFEHAAGQLESGVDRLHINDDLRSAIAQQPTSGQWVDTINTILQNAASPDAMIYAKNLRLLAQGLKQ